MTKGKTKKTARVKMGLQACPLTTFEKCRMWFYENADKALVTKILKAYVEEKYSKDDAKAILLNPEYAFRMHNSYAAAIHWMNKELKFEDVWENFPNHLHSYFESLKQKGYDIQTAAELKKKTVTPLNPQKLLRDKVNSTILTDLDAMLDDWIQGEPTELDVSELILKYEIKPMGFSFVTDWLQSQYDELNDAKTKNCEQAVEAYSDVSIKEINRRLKYLKASIESIQKYKVATKTVRKPRKKKEVPAEKLVANLKYLKSSSEYNLSSIAPTRILGSKRLYVFDAKTRKLTEYVAEDEMQLSVKGTTILNFDPEKSRYVKLRKPNDFIQLVMSKTPLQLNKEFEKLTTKIHNNPSSRLNDTTILLRSLNK